MEGDIRTGPIPKDRPRTVVERRARYQTHHPPRNVSATHPRGPPLMGRVRTVKPELLEDEPLGSVSRDARLLFHQLYAVADDYGRFRAAPAMLRSRLYPYDDDVRAVTVLGWLRELDSVGRIRLYEVNQQAIGDIPGWRQEGSLTYQQQNRVNPSQLPAWDDRDQSPPPAADDLLTQVSTPISTGFSTAPGASEVNGHSTYPNGHVNSRPSGEEPASSERSSPDAQEGKGRVLLSYGRYAPYAKSSVSQAKHDPSPSEVDEVWKTWLASTGRTRCRLDDKRLRAIRRAVHDHGLADVLDAVRGWVNDPWPERRQHCDVTVLLRDAAHVEKFRDLWRDGRPLTGRVAEQADHADEWLRGRRATVQNAAAIVEHRGQP